MESELRCNLLSAKTITIPGSADALQLLRIANASKSRMKPSRSQSAINDDSYDHRAIQQDPSDAGQIDILVALPYSKPQPKDCGNKVGAPRQERDSARFMADPDRKHLRNRH